MDEKQIIALATEIANRHNIWPHLVCAICEQESNWNPWAVRHEPAFFTRYVAPLVQRGEVKTFSRQCSTETEASLRAHSWGLMQVMGQVAREHGFSGGFLSELLDPEKALEVGCIHLESRIAAAEGNVGNALLLWNGGGNKNYPNEVLARTSRYKRL